MFKELTVSITGVSPLMMHNSQTANPLNQFAKALKEISGKRKKTDADYEAMSDIEFSAGMYVDANDRPVLPGEVIEGMFINAAKKIRLGVQAKAGMMSDGNWVLKYSATGAAVPKTASGLKEDMRFRDVRGVGVSGSRIMRTRPIFRDWSLEFRIQYNDELLTKDQIKQILAIGGEQVGMCDYRPKFGRFVVNSVK